MAYFEKSTGLTFLENHPIWVCETRSDEGSEVWFEIFEGAHMERNLPDDVVQYAKEHYPEHVWHAPLGMFIKTV